MRRRVRPAAGELAGTGFSGEATRSPRSNGGRVNSFPGPVATRGQPLFPICGLRLEGGSNRTALFRIRYCLPEHITRPTEAAFSKRPAMSQSTGADKDQRDKGTRRSHDWVTALIPRYRGRSRLPQNHTVCWRLRRAQIYVSAVRTTPDEHVFVLASLWPGSLCKMVKDR